MNPNDIHSVDFHCHLDLCRDVSGAYRQCDDKNCLTLAVTTTPKAFGQNQMLGAATEYIHAALGLHPQLVATRASEIALFEDLLSSTAFVGEVGLDAGPRFFRSFDDQVLVFDRILAACARIGGKVISIHSVRAAKQVLDAIEKSRVHKNCHPVLHWFSASNSDINRALELGCSFSVNDTMLRSPCGQALLRLVPSSRLLTETDVPFQEVDGRVVEAGEVGSVVRQIAKAHRKSEATMKSHIVANAYKLVESDRSW